MIKCYLFIINFDYKVFNIRLMKQLISLILGGNLKGLVLNRTIRFTGINLLFLYIFVRLEIMNEFFVLI
jgi:hypothetical protein